MVEERERGSRPPPFFRLSLTLFETYASDKEAVKTRIKTYGVADPPLEKAEKETS